MRWRCFLKLRGPLDLLLYLIVNRMMLDIPVAEYPSIRMGYVELMQSVRLGWPPNAGDGRRSAPEISRACWPCAQLRSRPRKTTRVPS
jgi:hypothetical protein